MNDDIHLVILRIPAILIALTVHEYAHGYIAWRRGDSTARSQGRLTFNPFAHLDIFGTLMLFFGPFGWAKPVPVNTMNLDNPKRDIIYVSAAGPVSNMILAVIFGLTLRFLSAQHSWTFLSQDIFTFLILCVNINLGLSFFNLLPIPPLDGSNILMGLLPVSKLDSYLKFIQHAPKVLFGLLIAEWGFHIPLFTTIITPLWEPYSTVWQYIIFSRKVM